MIRRCLEYVAMVVLLLSIGPGTTARAQSRLNEKDLTRLMQNVRDAAEPFRHSFAHALQKSAIRGTSREKDARELADTFAGQAQRASETFKHKRKAESEVAAMAGTAEQIDALVSSLKLNSAVTSQWEKLRTELHQVAQAFGVPESYLQSQSGMASTGAATSCLISVGAKRSRTLVNECLQVSPATHPPCNGENACSLIVDEIRRGCGMLGQDAPGFCAEYR